MGSGYHVTAGPAAIYYPERSAPAVKILHHTVLCLARKRIWMRGALRSTADPMAVSWPMHR